MGITIRKKKLKDSSESLYLDICHKGDRTYEFIGIKLTNPKTPEDKKVNKIRWEIANTIKTERELQLIKDEYEIKTSRKTIDFISYFEEYVKELTVKDKRTYLAVLKKLKLFINDTSLNANKINESFLRKFRDYLGTSLNNSSPYNYFKKLKKAIKQATKEKIFRHDPSTDVPNKKGRHEEKEILSFEEIKVLSKTYCGNKHVKNAFLFSCLTGLRFCDIKKLEWKNFKGDSIEIIQTKTNYPLTIFLNKDAKKILAEIRKKEGMVFSLPSHTGCLKSLRLWTKTGGIEKHITWHCARHSFGSNLLFKGADIYTVSKLLGHTSLKNTLTYVRESEELKIAAINKFPEIFNNI